MALYDELKPPEILQCPGCEAAIDRKQHTKAKGWGDLCPFCRVVKLEDFEVLDPMKGVETESGVDRSED